MKIFKKEFRIVDALNIAKCDEKNLVVFQYKVEQRHHLLWLVHWWGTPNFLPPHSFATSDEAAKYVWSLYPNATIYDCCSENKTKTEL